jgi:hypothetical protein
MAKKSGTKQIKERLGGGAVGEKHAGLEIEELKQVFLQFRREHRNRTRIPDMLRDAALATIQRGISADEVRRACRISPGQLIRWIECRGAFAQSSAKKKAVERARVFPVVEDNVGVAALQRGADESSGLHLRVGGWEVCIRREER